MGFLDGFMFWLGRMAAEAAVVAVVLLLIFCIVFLPLLISQWKYDKKKRNQHGGTGNG